MKLTTNLVIAEISAKEFARGMHSVIGSFKKIIINGVMMPPPPIPPALANKFIIAIRIIPVHSIPVGGQFKSVKPSSSMADV